MTKHLPPLLLFGMPRSGTTWVAKILDSHPDTEYRHEPDSGTAFLHLPLYPGQEDQPAFDRFLPAFIDRLWRDRDVDVLGKLPLFAKSHRDGLRFQAFRANVVLSKAAGRAGLRLPAFGYGSPRAGTTVLVWKSIESVGRLGAIVHALPAVRALLLLRHPCGFIASVDRGEESGKFSHHEASSADRGVFELLARTPQARRRGLDLDALMALPALDRQAWRWVLANEKAMEEIDGRADCMVVRYEDVCADPASLAQRMLGFAGLAVGAQTRAFLEYSTSGEDAGYYAVKKDPLAAANKWRERMPAADVERVLAIVRDTRPGSVFA
ncbi:MAG: sulfotransferase [Gammaproteobacteria bacterium]